MRVFELFKEQVPPAQRDSRSDNPTQVDNGRDETRSHPTKLTPHEASNIKEMVTATEYRHMPLRTVSVYAQKSESSPASSPRHLPTAP